MAEQQFDGTPPLLATYLEERDAVFRRRTVLGIVNGQPNVLCCTVEAFAKTQQLVRRRSQRYGTCELLEEWLDIPACRLFVSQLAGGAVAFGEHTLVRPMGGYVQWTQERVAFGNRWMPRAGVVAAQRLGSHSAIGDPGLLLNLTADYYPDLSHAARDWIPLVDYSGVGDGRNSQVIFLLPEARAYIESARLDAEGRLHLILGGDQSILVRRIKGAYWLEGQTHHIDCSIDALASQLTIPPQSQRLDFYLLGDDGEIYDFHVEDTRFGRTQGRVLLGGHHSLREEQTREAIKGGEGLRTEFKPFINPNEGLTREGHKTKLREVVLSIAAFANAEGGSVYMGIDDECTVKGVDAALAAWTEAAVDEDTIQRYLSVLQGKVRDAIAGHISLSADAVRVDGALIVRLQVDQASSPVGILGDYHLYVRKGGTNRKVPPHEWPAAKTTGGVTGAEAHFFGQM